MGVPGAVKELAPVDPGQLPRGLLPFSVRARPPAEEGCAEEEGCANESLVIGWPFPTYWTCSTFNMLFAYHCIKDE